MYGPRGQGNFLGRATTVIAATFMFTSITLAFYSRPSEDASTETLDAIRELEKAGTEVAVESDSEKARIDDLRSTELDIDLENAAQGGGTDEGALELPDLDFDEVLQEVLNEPELEENAPVDSDGNEE